MKRLCRFILLSIIAILADGCFQDTTSTTESGKLCASKTDTIWSQGFDRTTWIDVELKSCGNSDLVIDSVRFDDRVFSSAQKFPVTVQPNKTFPLRIGFLQSDKNNHSASMIVQSNAGTLKIELQAFVR
jgi:hypothetical protein